MSLPFSGINFQSNYLDRLDLATYHIIFYMLPPNRELTFDALDPNLGGAIIAESGVTGQITIDNLYSRAYTSESSHRKGGGTTTDGQKVTFTLKEHHGSGLFDKIRYTAKQLGGAEFDVKSGLYFLEISFRANNYPDSSDAVKLPMVYRWPIRITSIVAQVTPAGSIYDVVGVHEAQTALSSINQPSGVVTVDLSKSPSAIPTMIAQQNHPKPSNKYSASPATKLRPKQLQSPTLNLGQDQYAARIATAEESSRQSVQSGLNSLSENLPSVATTGRRNNVVTPRLISSSTFDFSKIRKNKTLVPTTKSGAVPPDFIPAGMDLVDWQKILADNPSAAQDFYDAEFKTAGQNSAEEAAKEQVRQQEELAEIERLGLNNQVYDPAADPRNLGGQSSLSISVGTVGLALKILAEELTLRSEADGYGIKYEIVAENVIDQMKMRVDAAGDQSRWSTMNYNEDQKKWVFAWAPGTSIDVMINDIILSSPDYQAYSQNSSVANGQNEEPDELKKLHKINATTYNASGMPSNDAEDVALMDIQVVSQLTYHYVTKEDQNTNPQVLAQSLSDSGQLRKRYFYLFTGLNDQVISLDLKFNLSWYVDSPVPNYVDYVTPNQSGDGEVKTNIKPSVNPDTNEKTKAIPKKPYSPQGRDAFNSAMEKVTGQKAIPVPLLENPAVPVAEGVGVVQAQVQAYQARVAKAAAAAAEQRRLQTESLQARSGVRFVEDAFAGKTSADIAKIVSEGKSTIDKTKETFRQAQSSLNPSDRAKGASQPKGRGRPFVNGLFAAAFNSTGDLSNIEMKIKGDPYWLGHAGTTGIALPTETGVPFFVLSVKNQELYDITTGLAIPSGPYADGLYQVRTIDSEFVAGSFTQTLFAVINPSTIDLDLSGYDHRIP